MFDLDLYGDELPYMGDSMIKQDGINMNQLHNYIWAFVETIAEMSPKLLSEGQIKQTALDAYFIFIRDRAEFIIEGVNQEKLTETAYNRYVSEFYNKNIRGLIS